jgi:hypothetical protein
VKRGAVRVEKVPAVHQHKHVNIIGAMKDRQMIALNSFCGSCNWGLFNCRLENKLYPMLSADDTLIMANARFHKKDEMRAIAKRYKCEILFLPPYSPELNPIEHY